jgi:hypothetical protein
MKVCDSCIALLIVPFRLRRIAPFSSNADQRAVLADEREPQLNPLVRIFLAALPPGEPQVALIVEAGDAVLGPVGLGSGWSGSGPPA